MHKSLKQQNYDEKDPTEHYFVGPASFQRPGTYEAVLTPYLKGTAKVTSSLYINSTAAPVCHIFDDRQSAAVFNDGDWGSDKKLSDGTYILNCMTGAVKYFEKGLYESSVDMTLDKMGSSLRVGIKCTSAPTAYWTMFDNFRLHFFGGAQTPNGIGQIDSQSDQPLHNQPVYDLQGRRLPDTNHLPKGLYIIGNKKVVK